MLLPAPLLLLGNLRLAHERCRPLVAVRIAGNVLRAPQIPVADGSSKRIGAVVGVRVMIERKHLSHHEYHLMLVGGTGADDSLLDLHRRVLADLEPLLCRSVPEDIIEDLRANFNGECSEVGMYLAMSRVAMREGYPEIGMYYRQAAFEEADHASRFAELLGEVVTDSTKKNLEMRVEAENGATAGKTDLAKRAKAANLDAIHDTVHEMARDEARHGRAFAGLLKRYFG